MTNRSSTLNILRWNTAMVLLATVVVSAAHFPADVHATSPATLIRNTTVIDGTGQPPLEHVDVLVVDDRIAAIGHDLDATTHTTVIDGTGKYVMPGLIDTHVHLQFPIVFQLTPEEKAAVVDHTPKAFLYNGVTTVLNVGSPLEWILEQRRAQKEGRLVAPRIFATGDGFKPEKGWGSRHGGALGSPAQARQMALDYVAARVDGFKVIIEDGLGSQGTHVEISPEMLQAIVEVSRLHDVPMYIHAINLHEYHRAADVMPRAIMHGMEDPLPAGDPLLEKLLANSVYVVPTVSLFESFLRPDPRAGFALEDPVLEASLPRFLLDNMRREAFMDEEKALFSEASHMDAYAWARQALPNFRENVRIMHQAGVKIAVGTDAGGTVGYNFQGYNTPWEVKLLVECGLTPMEALVAATRHGAEVIGVADQVGTVQVGKFADLLVLSANPLDDIENIRQIEWVIQNGQPHRREDFAVAPPDQLVDE
ncbi:MAG: amidohydrolase family protein [Xanthomonadales bacterium]|nr:amidohydrolase family protein [Xanthomonadales bacterium]